MTSFHAVCSKPILFLFLFSFKFMLMTSFIPVFVLEKSFARWQSETLVQKILHFIHLTLLKINKNEDFTSTNTEIHVYEPYKNIEQLQGQ